MCLLCGPFSSTRHCGTGMGWRSGEQRALSNHAGVCNFRRGIGLSHKYLFNLTRLFCNEHLSRCAGGMWFCVGSWALKIPFEKNLATTLVDYFLFYVLLFKYGSILYYFHDGSNSGICNSDFYKSLPYIIN